jgi:hypothetical protein
MNVDVPQNPASAAMSLKHLIAETVVRGAEPPELVVLPREGPD